MYVEKATGSGAHFDTRIRAFELCTVGTPPLDMSIAVVAQKVLLGPGITLQLLGVATFIIGYSLPCSCALCVGLKSSLSIMQGGEKWAHALINLISLLDLLAPIGILRNALFHQPDDPTSFTDPKGGIND